MLGSSPQCPRLCPECPLKPAGVTAELTRLETLPEDEMRDFKYAGDADLWRGADETLAETLRATFTVTNSTTSSVEVGAEASYDIRTQGQGHASIRRRFEDCTRPARLGVIARALGKSSRCNGLPKEELD
jgi:hypothetical protein